jgi:hypothetical protein
VLTAVIDRATLEDGEAGLTPAERQELAAFGFGPRRRSEWVAGRLAAQRALGMWLGPGAALGLSTEACGAPRSSAGSVSLSHDGSWVAVAFSSGRAAIDLCSLAHAERLRPILRRLSLDEAGCHPCEAWAALECALKLRREGIASLLDRRLGLERHARRIRVLGIGAPAEIEVALEPGYALGWAEEGV